MITISNQCGPDLLEEHCIVRFRHHIFGLPSCTLHSISLEHEILVRMR